MGNEERIKFWLAERQSKGLRRSAPTVDELDKAAARPNRSERMELHGDPADPGPAHVGSDDTRLEEARLAILDRRRERWLKLVRRAMLLVALPLLAILLYMQLFATPLHQGEAVFTVQTSGEAAPSPSAGLFAIGGTSSTIADAFKAREFILSRPMMDEMERRYGFMSHFASHEMDPLTRYNGPLGINSDPLAYYRKRVRVAVDVQEGILRLFVQARTQEEAVRFGNGILAAAEAHINQFSDKISQDQIAALTRDVQDAERQVADTRRSLAAVQARRGDLSPEQTATAVYQLISNLELQLAEAERERSSLLDQGLTESPLLPRLSARVEELRAQISEQRQRLANPGGGSLVRTLNEFEGASARKEIAQARWQTTLTTLQQAYLRILEQRRYFVRVVGMSVGDRPQVRDVTNIALPILFFLALLYAIVFVVRQIREEGGMRIVRFSQVTERWQR